MAAVRLASVLCTMRAGLNTIELTAFRCSNPLCKPSFCDEDHSAATKNLDLLRAKVFRANLLTRRGTDVLGGIFISYRREDSAGFAGRIYDRLTRRLDPKSVFLDVDNIPPGRDFVQVLAERVGLCDVLIAVIGRKWAASVDNGNRRRLDDPNDFVRIEIEAAFARGIRVIPVLVDGAAMPRPDDLPDSLRKLARRQGIEISHTRFDADVEGLTRALAFLDEELHTRAASEAERLAREERERQEAVAVAAEAEAARQAEEERRARAAAKTETLKHAERKPREDAKPPKKAEHAVLPTRPFDEQSAGRETLRKGGHLFISYCHKDEVEAHSLVDELEKRGPKCWLASMDVEFNYQREIVEAIRSALAVVILVSESANTSDEIPKEIVLARKYKIRTIPIRIEDAWPSGALEYELSNAQNIDLFKGRDMAIGRLIRLIASSE